MLLVLLLFLLLSQYYLISISLFFCNESICILFITESSILAFDENNHSHILKVCFFYYMYIILFWWQTMSTMSFRLVCMKNTFHFPYKVILPYYYFPKFYGHHGTFLAPFTIIWCMVPGLTPLNNPYKTIYDFHNYISLIVNRQPICFSFLFIELFQTHDINNTWHISVILSLGR